MATANATAASKVQETVSEEAVTSETADSIKLQVAEAALDIPKEETLIPFLKRSSNQKHHRKWNRRSVKTRKEER